jgi:hypothetical protein
MIILKLSRALCCTPVLLALGLLALTFAARPATSAPLPAAPVVADDVPEPLPRDCTGVNPPGQPNPCCAFGYVYYDGEPVAGADVRIESPYGTINTTTASGGVSGEPYYSTDLSSPPLLVSPGDVITVTATYENSSADTVYEVAPGGQQVDVVIPVDPLFGNGAGGDLTVTGTRYTDDTRAALISTASAGQENVPLSSTSGFTVGQEVLIVQMQGTGVGNYEFGTIASAGSGSLTLQDNLTHTYTVGGNSKAQVLWVPHYRNVTVQSGGKLTAHAWDGTTGGIVAFKASGMLDVQAGGKIDAEGKGYRDTDAPQNSSFRGAGQVQRQGESYVGPGAQSHSPNYGGGGGGKNETASEQWDYTPSGGGGYGTAGGNGTIDGSFTPGCGAGGGTYGVSDLATTSLGSAGGHGGGDWRNPGNGGADGGFGGGIVIIFAQQTTVSGSVTAKGQDGWTIENCSVGCDTGGAGGGAGGSIKIVSSNLDIGNDLVTALGGAGGYGSSNGGTTKRGGDGGVGRIRVEYCESLSGSTDPLASTQQWECYTAPIVTIHTVYPHPAVRGQDVVTFRGSAVDNDEDGASITQYVWRSDMDGVLSTQPTFTLTASSLSTGTHTLYFKARDDEGDWSEEVAATLTVNPQQGNPPEASFTVNPTSGYTTTVFSFDASGCSDTEDPVTALEVRWDWEDNGIYDTSWSTTKTITHTFASTGTYTIRLQVRDTDGLTGSTTHTVTVNPPAGPTAWLFVLYLDGDNNLDYWLQRALDNLEATTANSDLRVLALLDGYGNGNTWRYHVQPGGNYTNGVNRWSMGELDMGDPQTLADFVTWARDNYPADHTYLAVADHGRGTTGIAWDETSGSDEFISVTELRTALRDATSDGAAPLDVVHYDACLMAMIENAYQIKDYASYLVASENLGWSIFAYDLYAAQVTASTTPKGLATAVVNEYNGALAEYPRTISAVDLGQAGTVADTVTALATALQADLAASITYVSDTLSETQKFDSRDYYVINNDDEYLDLYDLARLLKQNVPNGGVKDAAQGVMDAVTAFVVAEQHESGYYRDHPYWDLDDAHGVAIYFPSVSGGWGYNDYTSHVFRFTEEGQWDEFLHAYYGLTGLPPEPPTDPGLPPVLNRPYAIYLPMVVRK